jgi:hypothetical protein
MKMISRFRASPVPSPCINVFASSAELNSTATNTSLGLATLR